MVAGLQFPSPGGPLAVLGLPGTFGRYVEYYRNRGQLAPFLRRTTGVSLLLTLFAIVGIVVARERIAALVFNDGERTDLILALAGVLLLVVAFNFLRRAVDGLRQVRVVSLLQFVSSMVFAGVALTLTGWTSLGAVGVLVGYAAGCGVAAVAAILFLWSCCGGLQHHPHTLPQRELWAKLVPFAAWVWVINLLTNLFEAADRYMIVHFAAGSPQHAQALVGQYHCSRVVPILLIAIAGVLSGVILPYLSADWEKGRRAHVSRQLNLAVKLTSLAFTACGVLVLWLAPVLFGSLLDGKYDTGLAVLP